jgi:L-lactate dehydrogenase complex protein LldF
VILVDNGRMKVRESALKEILYCIRCGACLNACPVFREIGGHAYVSARGAGSPYPGPVGSVVSPALFGQIDFGQLARASSLCGACREACPVDIDLPGLLLRIRAGMGAGEVGRMPKSNAPKPLSLGLSFYTLAASSPGRFRAAQWMAGLAGNLVSAFSKDRWMHLPAITGWGFSKFPAPAGKPFHARYKQHQFQYDEIVNLPMFRCTRRFNPMGMISLHPARLA